ncbi:LuxR C-terminal-related transcriptional regulator [Nocardioides sp. LHG3406-4]|uniref:LuxR C-terminal-related transcriptional regulator n=1 Tax=Nocardioides sp. LHG3406-4 TaxID=2804575 RepID=UPI003CE7D6E3
MLALGIPVHLTAEVAQFVFGMPDHGRLLDRLERESFLSTTIEDGEVVYSWEPGLRDALRAELTARDADAVRRLDRGLAAWYREHALPQHAVAQAMVQHDLRFAVEVVEGAWLRLIVHHEPLLRQLFGRVRQPDLEGRPRAQLVRCLVLRAPDRGSASVVSLPAAPEELDALGRSSQARNAIDSGFAQLIVLRAYHGLEQAVDLATRLTQVAHAARKVRTADVADLLPGMFLHVGLTHQLAGELEDAEAALYWSYYLTNGSPYPHVATDAAGKLALNAAFQGDLAKAETWLKREGAGRRLDSPLETVRSTGGLTARLLVAVGRLEEGPARRVMEMLGASDGRFRDEYWAFLIHARAQFAMVWGDRHEALEQLVAGREANADWLGPGALARDLLDATEAELLISLGRGSRAGQVLDSSASGHCLTTVARARFALLTGDPETAFAVAGEGARARSTLGPVRDDLLLVQGTALLRLGQRGAAIEAVRRAIRRSLTSGEAFRSFANAPRSALEDLAADIKELSRVLAVLDRRGIYEVYPDDLSLVKLTPREVDVLDHLARGLTLAQIATRRHVSLNTVKTQLNSIYRKLGVHSRTQALIAAHDLGVIDDPLPQSGARPRRG